MTIANLLDLDLNTQRVNISKVRTDPILYVGKLEDKLTDFIHANGDYLFMVFAVFCFFAIGWLLLRHRKRRPPELSSARTRAIVGMMLASPDLSTDADGGLARLIAGNTPRQKESDSN